MENNIPEKLPSTNIHTPAELLENAEILLNSSNSRMMRSSVLEAIAALESFVNSNTIPLLEKKVDPKFAKWLVDKTKFDFNSRLLLLTPLALDIKVDTETDLWKDFKKSKTTRNKVTHEGTKVSKKEAEFVIDTVYKWLEYLGSSVGIENSLFRIKNFIEEKKIIIDSEEKAINVIMKYFSKTKAAKLVSGIEKFNNQKIRPDLILEFGKIKTVIETKLARNILKIEEYSSELIEISSEFLFKTEFDQAALIIFTSQKIPLDYQLIRKIRVEMEGDNDKYIYIAMISSNEHDDVGITKP